MGDGSVVTSADATNVWRDGWREQKQQQPERGLSFICDGIDLRVIEAALVAAMPALATAVVRP